VEPKLLPCHILTSLPLQGGGVPFGVVGSWKHAVRGLEALPYEPMGVELGFARYPPGRSTFRKKKAHIFGRRKAKKETPAKVINPAREDGF
jgi:hypothetical protein